MSIIIETEFQAKKRQGKAFTFFHSELNLINTGTIDFLLKSKSGTAVVVNQIQSQGDLSSFTWQAFAGTDFTEGTGSIIVPTPRNGKASTESDTDIVLNPTILDDGQAFSPPIEAIGVAGAGGRNYIDYFLIENGYELPGGVNYLIRLTNNSGAAGKLAITFDMFNE